MTGSGAESVFFGCMIEDFANYDSTANVDSSQDPSGETSSCYHIFGCTDSLACNFDSEASLDDNTCFYLEDMSINLEGVYYDCNGDCISDVDFDGVCDELIGCPLGTDSTDCDQACQTDEGLDWPLMGVCAHDESLRIAQSNIELTDVAASEGEGGVSGTWDGVVTVRGAYRSEQIQRHYRVYAPRRLRADQPVPVVFALGGFTVDMYWLAEFTELNRMADREGFVVVYGQPEYRFFNFSSGADYVFAWYVYQQAWQGGWDENPDIAYLEAVLGEVSTLYNIDLSRVFVGGHSRGAGLSVIAAVERPDLFSGFGAHAGFGSVNDYNDRIVELGAPSGVKGVLIHGEDDPDVRVYESDLLEDAFLEAGWGDDLLYFRIPNATHEWQSQHNQDLYDFWMTGVQP